jgi:hypothetical protein
VLRHVYFIDDQNDRSTGLAEIFCEIQVERRGAGLAVNHEEEEVCAFDGDLRGGMCLLREIRVRLGSDSTGVDDFERHRAKLATSDDAVAGDAGLVVDNGNLATRQTIEERGLPDIRPADDGDITHEDYRDAASA